MSNTTGNPQKQDALESSSSSSVEARSPQINIHYRRVYSVPEEVAGVFCDHPERDVV